VGVIRAGHFAEFQGHDVLLLDADREGMGTLESWVRALAAGHSPQILEECAGVHLHQDLQVVAEVAGSNVGLTRGQSGVLLWRRTSSGWAEIADQLAALRAQHSGHQYLESASDQIVPIASLGEYDEVWWSKHAG
jgi:hypothetical protein